MNRKNLVRIVLLTLPAWGCQSPGPRPGGDPERPILFDGMGRHHRKITTTSAEAQRYFDQALTWTYAFNHDEAIRSYTEAAQLDPECAIAWWGVALCHGPHINNSTVPPERSKAASEAVAKAMELRDKAGPVEQALIDAVAKRYADPPPSDRKPLDQAYAKAMGEVWRSNRTDADVGTLYAESLMDLWPWDLWDKHGSPRPDTLELVGVLEEVLKLDPKHPGANHLYIHTVEASPHPSKGVASADRLREMVPIAGHLVHMPAHIDVRVGNWAAASKANERAIKADQKYYALRPRQDFYRVYMAHNHHFLSWASMMQGQSATALQAARDMIAGVPQEVVEAKPAMIDPYMGIALEALMRFGRWDDVLNEPAPPEKLPITTALWRFTRGIAQAAKGDVAAAEKEQAAFREAAKAVPQDALMAINPASKILTIADHMLAGEIAFRKSEYDASIRELEAGISVEDSLLYMEPPDWIQPVRHTLGAVLLAANKPAEAERVYREDLRRWPENGWALYGLSRSLRNLGAERQSDDAEQRFKKAWPRADIKISSSCLCATDK